MANSISLRTPQAVQFVIDTNPLGASGVSLIANRQFLVVDATVVNTTAGQIDGTIQQVDTSAVPVTTTISTLNTIAANLIVRPSLTSVPGAGFMNLDVGANATTGTNNTVVRGGTLKVTLTAAGDLASGYLTILPGNRYAASTSSSAYYANNAASGAQGSNPIQSI
jgi:hypothetical protein